MTVVFLKPMLFHLVNCLGCICKILRFVKVHYAKPVLQVDSSYMVCVGRGLYYLDDLS